ncbi:hypothetical protein [Methylobacterium oxalidis]|uniref:Uncharacterized protein n=1 Tax=Methylobacterium oxalidis TaxID=944322 RepID=A0A512J498_9HYPH|nr:hypothetical protein [Methylobacterium oxalidis]GEP04781.1 hypothetical protein MOX02_28190 [Methylobacterium oxalidis]GJE30480.1 hypothetical protein LDDCCGHA_0648 [Methylobacterium oxalidis]GLS63607.1 hypothetical protein GCM10007888_19880 [Methylobacterium oxalidis]
MSTAGGSRNEGRDETVARREQVRAHVRTVLRRLTAVKAEGRGEREA